MKRIQIIFLILTAVTVLSVINGSEDANFYSEYDTRFTCGVKYDFTLLHIGHEIKNSKNQEEVSSFIIHNAVTNSSNQVFAKEIVHSFIDPSIETRYSSGYRNDFVNFNPDSLIPSRAPPSLS